MPNRLKKTLDRMISKAGSGSRSDAQKWVKQGRVRINGVIAESPDQWVDPERDRITVDGAPLRAAEPVYVLLYKPKGYLTTYSDPQGRPTVYDLIQGVGQFTGTVGRLDLDTSGLLLLTNDTALADRLMDPAWHAPKTYLVKASTRLGDAQLDRLRTGVDLDDGPTRPATVRRIRDSEKYSFIEITITEGRNRQVRRMIEALGSKVLKLVRTRFGPLEIGDLEIGKYRLLERREVTALRDLVGLKNDADQESKRKLLVPQGNRPILGGRRGRRGLRD
ncbi:MAG: rRNA pseudouridine synthase [Acidobacteria bacterium]|nr:rRNA pseudouridine synthase [Acidobacteriota bacterium]